MGAEQGWDDAAYDWGSAFTTNSECCKGATSSYVPGYNKAGGGVAVAVRVRIGIGIGIRMGIGIGVMVRQNCLCDNKAGVQYNEV